MDAPKKHNITNTVRWKSVISVIVCSVILSAAILFIQDRLMLSRITDYCKLKTNIRNDKYTIGMEQQLSQTIIKLQTMAEAISEQTLQDPRISRGR